MTRYAARWAIEVTFLDTRQTLGVGQARNRTAQAVNRTWAFGMYVYTLVVLWAPALPNPPTRKSVRSSEHGHSQPHGRRKSSAELGTRNG